MTLDEKDRIAELERQLAMERAHTKELKEVAVGLAERMLEMGVEIEELEAKLAERTQ